jgi:hypothetical protein
MWAKFRSYIEAKKVLEQEFVKFNEENSEDEELKA